MRSISDTSASAMLTSFLVTCMARVCRSKSKKPNAVLVEYDAWTWQRLDRRLQLTDRHDLNIAAEQSKAKQKLKQLVGLPMRGEGLHSRRRS